MNTIARFISRVGLGVGLGVALGACKEEPDLEGYCGNKSAFTASCGDEIVECDEAPCEADCVSYGEGAADFSDACGELWIEIYECFVTMSCEGVEAWRTAQRNDTFEYPCGELESKFRAACPDMPLYGPNS